MANNIRIDDDVPLPGPDKPDTWINRCCDTCKQPIKPNELTGTECGCIKAVKESIGVDVPSRGTWTTGKPGPITEVGLASDWVTAGTIERTTFDPPLKVALYEDGLAERVTETGKAKLRQIMRQISRYPAETTYDAKGVPTVNCFLVGGPLNGRNGPIVGTVKVVELNVYAADGSVSSVELYELGDRGDLGARYWKGSKSA